MHSFVDLGKGVQVFQQTSLEHNNLFHGYKHNHALPAESSDCLKTGGVDRHRLYSEPYNPSSDEAYQKA